MVLIKDYDNIYKEANVPPTVHMTDSNVHVDFKSGEDQARGVITALGVHTHKKRAKFPPPKMRCSASRVREGVIVVIHVTSGDSTDTPTQDRKM